jgi:hypothetical protein
MTAEDRTDIIIENNVATWELRTDGDISGTYQGIFKFKCFLDPMEQIRANREYRELIGPHHLTLPEHESFLAYALTQLKYRVLSAPPFWTSTQSVSGISGNLPDENIISEVLTAAMDSEIRYRGQLKKKKTEALDKARKAAEKMIREQQGEAAEDQDESES